MLTRSVYTVLSSAAEALCSLFYPAHCPHCDNPVDGEAIRLCRDCRALLRRIVPPFCETCSQPFHGGIDGSFRCPNCDGCAFHFETAVSSYMSAGVLRSLIHRFKYGRQLYLRHPLAGFLVEACRDPRIARNPVDLIVPVPLHPSRERHRHFNQALQLALPAGKQLGVPVVNCLRRIRYTTPQTRFDREARKRNLHDAFALRQNSRVRGKAILLVDDVFTTGSTANECARVLCGAGAGSVRVATVARG